MRRIRRGRATQHRGRAAGRSQEGLLEWALSPLFLFAALATPLAGAAEEATRVTPDKVATAKGDLLIYPLNHATFVLRWNDLVIYVDPAGGAGRFQGIPAPNLILITDIHGDHMNPETVKAVGTEKTGIIAPEAVKKELEKSGVDPQSIQVLANGKKAKVLGIEIEAVPMYNLTQERLKFHAKGRGNGYVLDLAGTRVYISGDTEDIPEMRKLEKIDVAFVCMNLPYTMTAEQAAGAVAEMKPRIVYPYHYQGPERFGWQDPARFNILVQEKAQGIEVRVRDWYAVK
jgi:L-ascorbate metabolism protein UlaG (beta-lactamase superfamily)